VRVWLAAGNHDGEGLIAARSKATRLRRFDASSACSVHTSAAPPFTSFHKLPDILAEALERKSPPAVRGTGGTFMARLQLSSHGIEESTDYGSTPDALFQLGLMYCVGRDVELDLIQAHKWFNLAAMRGNDDAKLYRFELSREMSKPQIARAQRLAREWIAAH
jgi:hypothetical protein